MNIGVNSRIYQNKNSGIPYYIQCLYSTLLSIDTENTYTFFQSKDNKKLGTTTVFRIFDNYLGALLFDLLILPFLAYRQKIDILHGPSHTLPLFKPKGMRYVLTVHDIFLIKFPQMSSVYFRLLFRIILKHSLRIADRIVADSDNTKRDLIETFDVKPEKIFVVHLGVDKKFFADGASSRLIEEAYFFSITTHPVRKNIMRVLDVMASHPNLHGFKYVIAGLMTDDTLSELRHKVEERNLNKSVTIFGFATEDELISLYTHAQFFIYPSYYEGFGFPVLEAMACGCPVITSNSSSLPEIVPDTNWLINPYSNDDIYEKIKAMIELTDAERSSLIERQRVFVEGFKWEYAARKMLEVFKGDA